MRLLHFIEIENFKRFGGSQRIELDHPSVLIGPNNCGKTSAIQAIALWSQALKTWFAARKESVAKERPATALNRLSITAVPVLKTRYFWHNARVHTGRDNIAMSIAVGLCWQGQIVPVRMRFRHQGDELVYCSPDDAVIDKLDLLEYAAKLNVELLYPMSGLTTEEPILKPGRINVLLGQGDTAQVLRNLCLIVAIEDPLSWNKIVVLMRRLFSVELESPKENPRGSIDLFYLQPDVKDPLDISMAGRGFQQLLLIFAYLYSHQGSVLLIDEPDAHLEILRQKQVYVLLREIAEDSNAQVIMVTHSEVILDEALDHNLTLLLDGQADELAAKTNIRNTLKHYGAEHYVKARERGYILYVEGSTDVAMLRTLAECLNHPLIQVWDERINVYYVRDNFPEPNLDSELERVEGGFGITPKIHFFGMRQLIPELRGLAILDNDGKEKQDVSEGGLKIVYWRRYELENYFISPEVLSRYVAHAYADLELFQSYHNETNEVLQSLILDWVFEGVQRDYQIFQQSPPETAHLIWQSKTERLKLSDFAEEFFRRLAAKISLPILLRKGEFHRLIAHAEPNIFSPEIADKLSLLDEILRAALKKDKPECEDMSQ